MEKQLGKNIADPKQRIDYLLNNCDVAENKSYMKRFTPIQLLQMKEELSENAIRINDIAVEKKEANNEFKSQLKPLAERKNQLLSGLKNKAELVNEKCYKFIDLEAREVGFYNEEGDLIDSRPAYADELQTNIFQVKRTGTDS